MKAVEVRRRFLDFFALKHGHKEIPSSSLIPENDPTVLFTTAGMHPLVPYLMGEPHPEGKRLVDVQKCLRTDDIDEVGDPTHCTFFEMLGNWSLGDYFKAEAIQMSYEFLTSSQEEGGLGLDGDRLMVTCFAGDSDAPRDQEAADEWKKYGFKEADASGDKRLIYFYEKKKNWWGPAGLTGPCGPDTEMFYDFYPELSSLEHKPGASEAAINKYPYNNSSAPNRCHANCECGRYVEIWNDVFMQYNKNEDGSFVPLKQQNVDTGMGLERVTAILQGKPTHYETELFESVIHRIKSLVVEENTVSERIIADHVRSSTFILGDDKGVTPSNVDQGYILRRLIRRAIRHGRKLGIKGSFLPELARLFIGFYADPYKELVKNEKRILESLAKEEEQFEKTLEHGEKEIEKDVAKMTGSIEVLSGDRAFYYFESFGFPLEMTVEMMAERGIKVDEEGFKKAFAAHQEKSRAGAEQKFAGGLQDHSLETRRLHTATHLMLEALRRVLGKSVEQKGSNITHERLRFDFNCPEKLTPEQIAAVEKLVNDAIRADYPVHFEEMTVEEARNADATGVFVDKYEDELHGRVKVYFMGDYSKEICGGPHVEHTGELGNHFKILKEESSSSGVRRIKAILE